MDYEIRELKLGGVLDQGINVLKDNFGLLLSIMAFVFIPYQLISVFVQIAVLPEFLVAPNPGADPNAPPNIDLDAMLQALLIVVPFMVLGGIVIIPLTNAAVIYALAQKYLGRDVTAGEAIRKGFSKILPLLGTSILYFLAVMGGTLLCIIPGIIFALWFSLYQQVVVLEDTAGPEALGRSRKLVTPYLGNLIVIYLILMLIGAALGGPISLIPQPHIQGVLQVLIQAIATLFSTAVLVVFYFSCRSGVENFDLEHLAESVEESAYGGSERSPFGDERF